ncbi:MAG: FliM/FliN family flagellar motor switch protein [Peptococcaceae bacterium]|nr:FliM/FliN family flagellar motor switch protein [Peptococcaceae bacterium]
MAENLSQSQIDELLKKMHSGSPADQEAVEEPKAKVKEYDFASPKKFTKDQLNSLSNLYETFSRVVASYYTSILRDICDVSVVQIEEQRYFEFNNALPDNTLVAMIDFRPEEAIHDETVIMLELAQSFGYLLIERLMGSTGDVYIPDRDYTDIEEAILESVLSRVSVYLKEAWCNYFTVATLLRGIETNGRMIQAFAPQDIVVIVTMEISCGSFSCTSNICMPSDNLDAVISSFSTKFARASKQQAPEKEKAKKDLVLDYLKQSDLLVEAVLDKCQMSFGDVLQLQVNDVIALNKRIDSDVCVTVDGVPWYNARLGESKTKKAVKLIDTITI